jgi:WD40 repeat protein
VLLTSSRGDQQSFQVETPGEGELRQMSVFTAGLVDGLRTGEADRDRDGLISVEDAFEHAVDFVHEQGALQNPQRWLHDAEGRIILAFSPFRDGRGPEPRPGPQPRVTPSPPAQSRSGLPLVRTLSGDDGWIHEAAFTPDGTLLVAVTGRGRALGWDPETGEGMFSTAVGSEAAGLWRIAVSADGQLVAAGGGDGTVSVFDSRTRRAIRRFDTASTSVHALAFSPDAPLLAAALSDTVNLWIPRSGIQVRRQSHKDAHAISLAYGANGSALAVGADDGTIQVWDRELMRRLHYWPARHGEPVLALAYLLDGRMIAHAHGSSVEIWSPESGTTVSTLLHSANATVAALAVSPHGELLATATDDGAVHLWDPTTSKHLTQVDAHVGGASTVAFHPKRALLATGGADQAVRLWQLPVR